MTVLLPNSAFLHIPRTGGTWIREVLAGANLIEDEIVSQTPEESTEGSVRSWHNVPSSNAGFLSKEHIFCFVRHPLTWYQSYWAYKAYNRSWVLDAAEKNKIDVCASHFFREFIDNVIDTFPDGYLAHMFYFYASKATLIGKLENLHNDLVAMLTEAGENFRLDDILRVAPANVADKGRKKAALYRADQITKILHLERDVIGQYDYYNTMPFLRLG
jgi:hypothetical protein